jgi:RimJ/RimL family protein N-acetyltransferase
MIAVKDQWNKGFGTEATKLFVAYGFETLNLNRIELRVYEYNARAIRVYEKVGFKHEGSLREDHYRQGRYWNTHVMSILRSEWKSPS